MRKFIIFFSLLISASLYAENASNVRVRQEGNEIIITYDLSKKSSVRVYMSSNNSSYFRSLDNLSGDIGNRVSAGINKQVVWRPLELQSEFVADGVRFKVEAQDSHDYFSQRARENYENYAFNIKVKNLLMAQVSYSFINQYNYGALFAQMYRGIGWYVSGRTNANFYAKEYEHSCDDNGEIYVDGEYMLPFYTGRTSSVYWLLHGGYIMNFLEWSNDNLLNTFGMYLGCGYGKRELYWEMHGGDWVKYAPTSYEGITAACGFFGSAYGVTFSVGVSTINFKYLEIEAGIGFMF